VNGKHRHPATVHLTRAAALLVALGAAAFMLHSKPSSKSPAAASPEQRVEQVYKGAMPGPVKEKTADGARITPLFFLDAQRFVGTASAADGSVRFLLENGTGERELRKLPKVQTPEFAGFAVSGDRLVWMELTTTTDGLAHTQIWTIDNLGAAPRMVTADTGDVALYDKRDDVVIHNGQISWVAAARTDLPTTEVRSVPVTGGKVTVDSREGAYTINTWPWLVSVSLGADGPVEMSNMDTSERVVVGAQANELMACSPVWCRAVIIGSTENSTVIEVLKPDGSKRLRTASGNVAASIVDVALLDRFEIYSRPGGKLVLVDLEQNKTATIANGIGQVASRGPVIWWSTGDNETIQWHVLDLRSLNKP
jgi:hypothetical protein